MNAYDLPVLPMQSGMLLSLMINNDKVNIQHNVSQQICNVTHCTDAGSGTMTVGEAAAPSLNSFLYFL